MNKVLMSVGKKGGIIHVNRQFIALNAKDGKERPVFTIKPDGPASKPIYAREVSWDGPTELLMREEQLKCGARVWISIPAAAVITLTDPMSFEEAKTV